MTDTITDTEPEAAARRARLDELQRRRAATPGATSTATDPSTIVGARPAHPGARPPRAGAARGSKIAAAASGFAAMLGLVAAMGYAGRSSATPPQPAPAPAQVVVVVHPAGGTATPGAAATPGTVAASGQPIVLTAQPTVRQASASQTATGQTNGSR